MPPGFHILIAAQFVSALADNALLIVVIALLQQQGHAPWWAPLPKASLTVAYVLLAPLVGALADACVKARLMMAMNALKAVGVALLLAGAHPLVGFAVIGVAAAAYAPAKYGLVTELVPPKQLVAANGWIEVTTVCSVLLGVVLGGALVSPGAVHLWTWVVPGVPPLSAAMGALLAGYALAALLNLGIPDSGVRYRKAHRSLRSLLRSFWRAQRVLWRDADGGLSMAATTLFWGAAAVLQLAVLRWAVDVLGLSFDRAAYLQGAVAVGIVAGAAVAGHRVPLHAARSVLPLGIVMGLAVPAAAAVDHWLVALPVLVVVGALGGAMVVPLNALLQHRGHALLTAGRSIAVQNFNENSSVLVMLGVYTVALGLELDIRAIMAALGVVVAAASTLLWRHGRGRRPMPVRAR